MPRNRYKIAVAGLATLATILFLFTAALPQAQDRRSGSGGESILPAGAVVNGDYFAFGSLAEISGTVNGDVYASTGQVVIDGKVNGDVLVAGGRVKISGAVAQDV